MIEQYLLLLNHSIGSIDNPTDVSALHSDLIELI